MCCGSNLWLDVFSYGRSSAVAAAICSRLHACARWCITRLRDLPQIYLGTEPRGKVVRLLFLDSLHTSIEPICDLISSMPSLQFVLVLNSVELRSEFV
jgi:hypothetical protein